MTKGVFSTTSQPTSMASVAARRVHKGARGATSVVNSVSDTLFCVVGFALARLMPVRWSLALVVVNELALAALIHDNLALNVWQLVDPTKALSDWQASGGYVGSGRLF